MDRSTPHVAELHERLRAWLLEAMPREAPDAIASALMYEVVSIVASVAETKGQARALLREYLEAARGQIEAFGVGRPHP